MKKHKAKRREKRLDEPKIGRYTGMTSRDTLWPCTREEWLATAARFPRLSRKTLIRELGPCPAEATLARFNRIARKDITGILFIHGESLLNDRGVDRKVCREIAKEICAKLATYLSQKPIRVMVAVRGGVVQGALTSVPGVRLEVHDYDVFDTQKKNDKGQTEKEAEKEWDRAQKIMHAIF